ncbi:hypothetical protein [Amphibiibacter pelophylacis]|uniref:Uncharacterized protein n=1 Tax=Amphibiibacter pelophylacis TaxID=1799477 RepID=A0ACC6P467_9BURK
MNPPASTALSVPPEMAGDPAWADTEIDDSRERHALAPGEDDLTADAPAVRVADAAAAQPTAIAVPPRQLPPRRALPQRLPLHLLRDGVHLLLAGLSGMGAAWLGQAHYGSRVLGASMGFVTGALVLWGVPALVRARRRANASGARKSSHKPRP